MKPDDWIKVNMSDRKKRTVGTGATVTFPLRVTKVMEREMSLVGRKSKFKKAAVAREILAGAVRDLTTEQLVALVQGRAMLVVAGEEKKEAA